MLKQDEETEDRPNSQRVLDIWEWNGNEVLARTDVIAAEAPLAIALQWLESGQRTRRDLAVTMRTPGHDFELAKGFLFAEGVITSLKDIQQIRFLDHQSEIKGSARILVSLTEGIIPDIQQIERQFTAYASCGLCGKNSIDSIESFCPFLLSPGHPAWSSKTIRALPSKLLEMQQHFEHTGGMHAAALFDTEGRILMVREDIGRHNAVDKLIGAALSDHALPFREMGLLLSGRAGFELVQKALMAGIPMVAAIGAASSLAIDLAIEHGQTLVGFLRENRMIQYSGWERIQ